jgi:Flp pilus assembly secretin CpaC
MARSLPKPAIMIERVWSISAVWLYIGAVQFYPSFGWPQDFPIEKPPLVLGQGEQRLLYIPGLIKYSLGSNSVHILQLQKKMSGSKNTIRESLLLKGVTPGITDLWVWKQDGTHEFRTIRVEKRVHDTQNRALERALGHLKEAEIIFSGHGVILRGEISTLDEVVRIAALSQQYSKEIHDETHLSETFLSQRLAQLNQWIKMSRLENQLRIEQVGDSLWLRGYVERPQERLSMERKAKAIFPLIKTEIDSLPDYSPTVHFRVFLLELKKSQFRSFGLAWPAKIEGLFHVAAGKVQDLLTLDLTLHQLEGEGSAKILSNPELVVRAPGEAELFAGGELPLQQQNRYYSNVSWKNYGLTLRLNVTHCAGDKVRLDIFTEVSHLDTSSHSDRIPGVQANRMKTQVDARFGIPLFLSGLLQQGVREEVKGLPFLKNIPVLGALFGSSDYMNERSELVAILYPHSTPPEAPPEKQTQLIPRGPLPLPRNWLSPQEERALKESEDYPWNVLN